MCTAYGNKKLSKFYIIKYQPKSLLCCFIELYKKKIILQIKRTQKHLTGTVILILNSSSIYI